VNTRMQVADLNAIETRVGAWVAQCHDLLNVFQPYTDPLGNYHRNGRDSYIAFGVKVYPQFTYENLFLAKEGHFGKDKKGEAKRIRQFGKIGVLGSIYRMGGGEWGKGKASYIDHVAECTHKGSKKHICKCPKVYDRIRTGLWGFAYGQGVDMEQKDAHLVTKVFRDSYVEIAGTGYGDQAKGIWTQLEEAVLDVMDPAYSERKRYVGPNDCIKIDKLCLVGRNPLMRIHLPSGRKLHYMDAYIGDAKMPFQNQKTGEDIFRPALHYWQENDKSQWGPIHTHGGKIFENIVQGIARDVLAAKLLAFEKADIPVRGHVHDEGVSVVKNDLFSPTFHDMVEIMSEPIDWAPGLLLGAAGFEDDFFHK
jgi:hypothetical protein